MLQDQVTKNASTKPTPVTCNLKHVSYELMNFNWNNHIHFDVALFYSASVNQFNMLIQFTHFALRIRTGMGMLIVRP